MLSAIFVAAVLGSANLAAPAGSPFAGTWSGTYDLGGGNGGVTTITITQSGHFTGTYFNTTQGVGGIVRGQVRNDGSFNANGFRGDLPSGVDITCGAMSVVGSQIVTTKWGTPDNDCDNGWSQVLNRR